LFGRRQSGWRQTTVILSVVGFIDLGPVIEIGFVHKKLGAEFVQELSVDITPLTVSSRTGSEDAQCPFKYTAIPTLVQT
jgi:hypothetical protein